MARVFVTGSSTALGLATATALVDFTMRCSTSSR